MVKKNLVRAIILSAALPIPLIGFFHAGSASAATVGCTYDGSSWFLTTTSTACAGNLAIGDKQLNAFNISGTYLPVSGDQIFLSQAGANYGVQYQFIAPSTTAGSFDYTVGITQPGNTFNTVFANYTGTGANQSTSVTSSSFPGTASSTFAGTNLVSFNSGVTSATFSQIWSAGGSSNLTSFGITFTQSTSSVPGPLPVLGAGAAFGFSRKLRKRIKQSV